MIADAVKLTALVAVFPTRQGMDIRVVSAGARGFKRARASRFAALILDVMSSGLRELDVPRPLRAGSDAAARSPLSILTARGGEVDKVPRLKLGADDCPTRPFASRALAARLRAVSRRSRLAQAPASGARGEDRVARAFAVELDVAARRARCCSQLLMLTAGEFAALEPLMRHDGEVVTREAIFERALGRRSLPHDRSLDVRISDLRRKSGANSATPAASESARGTGDVYARLQRDGETA